MNKLLAWAVFTLAIMAGFSARAANLNPVIIIKTESGLVQCRLRSHMTASDSRLSAREFNNYVECKDSAAYAYFKDNESIIAKPVKPKPGIKPKPKPIESKMVKYAKNFEKQTDIKVGHIKFTLGKTPKDSVGVCDMKTRNITINKEYWNGTASEFDRELTIYHELGHCVLNRAHYNPKDLSFYSKPLQNKCPRSIMYKSSYSANDAYRCFHEHRAYYWKELVGGTYAMRAYKVKGYDETKVFSYYLDIGTHTERVGAFTCTFTKGTPLVIKDFEEAFLTTSISCTRDNVIFIKSKRFAGQAIGDNAVSNLTVKVLNGRLAEVRFKDDLLNEEYVVRIVKVSNDLW